MENNYNDRRESRRDRDREKERKRNKRSRSRERKRDKRDKSREKRDKERKERKPEYGEIKIKEEPVDDGMLIECLNGDVFFLFLQLKMANQDHASTIKAIE